MSDLIISNIISSFPADKLLSLEAATPNECQLTEIEDIVKRADRFMRAKTNHVHSENMAAYIQHAHNVLRDSMAKVGLKQLDVFIHVAKELNELKQGVFGDTKPSERSSALVNIGINGINNSDLLAGPTFDAKVSA